MDVSFSETNVTVMEGNGSVTLQLSLMGELDSGISVSVQVRSRDGTATGESEVETGWFNQTSISSC